MLAVAIILLIVGAGLIYTARYTDRFVAFAGAVCIIIGVVLILLWLLDAADSGSVPESTALAILATRSS